MALGAGAEAKLAEKRVLLRITVLGSSNSGKTTLINSFVNNVFYDRYQPTENFMVYHRILSTVEEDAAPNAPKFNTLVELEDTPGTNRMEDKDFLDLCDPYWPKPPEVANKRLPKEEMDKVTKRMKSVHLPFSTVDPPLGKFNDEGDPVKSHDAGVWAGKFFCNDKEKPCGPLAKSGVGRQCRSCRRLQASLTPKGQYCPISRQRMAYIFTFDANDKDSYLEVLGRLQQFWADREKKPEMTQKPLVYLVGTKIDKDPESQTYIDITGHLEVFCRQQADQGNRVTNFLVSSLQFRYVLRLFRTIVQDLRNREPLWKQAAQGEGAESSVKDQNCTVQ